MTRKLADHRPIIRLALSRLEVALAIGVSTSSVDQMVAEGALPPPRKWHSRKLWLVSEVEAYLNEWPSDGNEPVHTAQVLGVGGYPIILDSNDAVKQYYDKLGFDPATMGQAEMTQLIQEADERWLASIPSKPLGKRERKALAQLVEYGVGIAVDWEKIKDCGDNTAARLEARGFIQIQRQNDSPDLFEGYILTSAGLRAWEKLSL